MSQQPHLEESPEGRARHDSQDQPNHLNAKATQSALAIPEIILLISRYLDQQALAVCLRVCRQWQNVLHYQLWEVVEKRTGKWHWSGSAPWGPTLPLSCGNARYLRKLVLNIDGNTYSSIGLNSMHYPNLSELTVTTTRVYTIDNFHQFIDECLSPFIEQHQAGLKKLVLRVDEIKSLSDAMTSCSHLESLTARHSYFEYQEPDNWMDWYAAQGCRLKSLAIAGMRFVSPPFSFVMTETMTALLAKASDSTLQNLDLATGYPNDKALFLVMKSPDLRRLCWPGSGTIARLAKALEDNPSRSFCQKLESLSIPGQEDMDPADFQRVMKSLPSLTELNLEGGSGPITPSLMTLRLRKLRIDAFKEDPSTMIQDILCSVPTLEVLTVECMSESTILEDPRPWICTGLRELTTGIIVYSGIEGHGLIMDRLATLEKLERLTVLPAPYIFKKPSSINGAQARNMQLTLEMGLDRLSTLKQLRALKVADPTTEWGGDEAKWALKNWDRLIDLDVLADSAAVVLLYHRFHIHSIMPRQQCLEGLQRGRPQHEPQRQERRLNVTPPHGPLSIPELLDLTGRYLDRYSLAMCLRVCRQWRKVLHCQLWEVIEKRTGGWNWPGSVSRGPTLPLSSENASHLRKLVLRIDTSSDSSLDLNSMHYPNLSELTVSTLSAYEVDRLRRFLHDCLSPFIVQHQTSLKKLVLFVDEMKPLTDALLTCSRLESLTAWFQPTGQKQYFLGEKHQSDRWMEWYEAQGRRLKSLSFMGTRVGSLSAKLEMGEAMAAHLAKASESTLQDLELAIEYPTDKGLFLVMKSPNLKRLYWPGSRTIARLAKAFENDPQGSFCQKLESLSIPNLEDLDPADFQRVMKSLPSLTDLYLPKVCPHLATLKLRKLRIDECKEDSTTMVQDILCSMPTLEVLTADCVSESAIQEDPRPWICRGLRELTTAIIVSSGINGHRSIMERLATLERLEKLSVLSTRCISKNPRGANDAKAVNMQLTLAEGLDRLSTLRQLRAFKVADTTTRWGADEAKWALKNWGRLIDLDVFGDCEVIVFLHHRLRKIS
ncbi:hypothetical protein EMPS_07106 [Entomortierella parvispora]|uniref:F-box domain-containing protein n=1 Tax=Entomortierella parvispora TaxID=205924 RepID=A0A9P3HE97_9FUNG|nr:hypothetical protein EMPS_07106 [Entomortierella parvispora]